MTMHEVIGTFVGRWYVTLLGAVFLWCAVRHLGWRRTLAYTVPAVLLGALFENGSVHLGVPYTRYAFDPSLRGDELFIGDVPLMVPLSYTFMGYFAFAAGRLVASGPRRTRARLWQEYVVGVVLMVWAVWVFDPVSRLGDRWFLGPVFHYAGPGFWFGLPLGSQLGFTLTAVLLVGWLSWLGRNDADRRVPGGFRRHPHALALLTYHGQVAWLAIVAVWLGATELGGSALLMWVPAAAVVAVHWSGPRPLPPDDAYPEPAAATAVATDPAAAAADETTSA